MKNEYDFSQASDNPYAKILKKQVTIRLDSETINYFKGLSKTNNIPYQTLINLYLRDCALKNKKLQMEWEH
jgi:predicted DNA binding CopG/RHH family protein